VLKNLSFTAISNPSSGSDWFDFLSRSNAINENQGSSGRRSSSSTWPKNGDNMDARKESAVRGQGGGGDEDVMKGEVIPTLTSPEERIGEGDAGTEDTSNDADTTGV
jgi:hypothetical protein